MGNDRALDSQTAALLKKQCYQSAVKIVNLTIEESNFVKLHQLSTDLAQVVYRAVVEHLNLKEP